ncbi:MAG: peptidylprolyl isomerase [Steroidobacteraceae bacterium]
MKYRYVFALALIAATTACSKGSVAVPDTELLATVNGEKISTKEFDAFVTAISNGSTTADKLTAEQRTKLVDRLIGMHIAATEATKAGLDKQGDAAVQISLWRNNILSDTMTKEYLAKNPITDADIQAEYDTQIAAMPREYHASHILVKTQEEADKLIAAIKGGADFAALAKKNSTDPGSAKEGGDLGWFSPASMVPEFGAAVAQLENGQMTETAVKTQYGFHIIKLQESRTPTPPALADVKTQVESIVKNKKIENYLSDLRKTAKIEMAPAASSSSSSSEAAAASSTSSSSEAVK